MKRLTLNAGMRFEIIEQGFLSRRIPGSATAVAVGPRCVVAADGSLICSFMVQSALAVNDFVPVLARSRDEGRTWEEDGPIWPSRASQESLFCSISRSRAGALFLYGISTPIDTPGESFWRQETMGMKQNSLFWATSSDSGRRWSEPRYIPMPFAGSAEAPGPLCVTSQGSWLACYAPYNTFDADVRPERNQSVALRSRDRGANWTHQAMLRFPDPASGGGEAWVVELADGRLLATCWNLSFEGEPEYPNPFAISEDDGDSWGPTCSTGIMGQSTALAALPDGRALMVYNQRKHAPVGVWLAVARPRGGDFGLLANECVWSAETATQHGSSAEHKDWSDFAFGEPSVTILPNGELLVVLWCIQRSGRGIAFVKLRMYE